MVIVELFGGLGNQMFQYAFGRALALKFGVPLKLDVSSFVNQVSGVRRSFALGCFKAEIELATPQETGPLFWRPQNRFERALFRIRPPRGLFCENGFHFQPEVFAVTPPRFYRGHWQSCRYFEGVEQEVRTDFQLRAPFSPKASEWLSLISASTAVSLHVRRGDYAKDPSINRVHGTCSLDYYRDGAAAVEKTLQSPTYFIFSDDVEWVKRHFGFLPRAYFIEGLTESEDLLLMAACRHHIIANSSFSWWGAWLNPSADKMVIAPKRWFQVDQFDTKDLLPKTWLTL